MQALQARPAAPEATNGAHADENGTPAAGGRGRNDGATLALQGKCRSLAAEARHASGQAAAERLRGAELANKLAERDAEVQRLLVRVQEVRA